MISAKNVKKKKTRFIYFFFFSMLFSIVILFVDWNVFHWKDIRHHEIYIDFRQRTIFSGSTR